MVGRNLSYPEVDKKSFVERLHVFASKDYAVLIDHFRVAMNLNMKARLSAKLFIRKLVFFADG